MSNRIKAISEIGSRAEFDQTLENIVTMQLTKERLELRRDKALLNVKLDYAPDIADLVDKMEKAVLSAEKYATTHREELLPGKKKTAETGVTFFGFRTGNPTLVLLNRKWSWQAVLEKLKSSGRSDLIITKEDPNKDAMKAGLDDAGLAEFGTRIKQDETFFIEPKRDAKDPLRLVTETKAA